MPRRKTIKSETDYWERVLVEHNLSMDRGLNPRQVSYVGTSNNLAVLEKTQAGVQSPLRHNYITLEGLRFYNGGRRVRPKGHGPDKFEIEEDND